MVVAASCYGDASRQEQGEWSGVAESNSRPQSDIELVAGLEKGCSLSLSIHLVTSTAFQASNFNLCVLCVVLDSSYSGRTGVDKQHVSFIYFDFGAFGWSTNAWQQAEDKRAWCIGGKVFIVCSEQAQTKARSKACHQRKRWDAIIVKYSNAEERPQ